MMLDVFIFNLLLDPLTSSPGRDVSDVSDNKELLDRSLETGVGIMGGGVNINENKFNQVLLFQLQPQLVSGAALTLRTAAVQTVSLQHRSKLVSTHF